MIQSGVDMATKSKGVKDYSIEHLSKYFGVSITTINNWVSEGRFIGVSKEEKNKQARINENVYWKSSNGEIILIKEVVNMYNKNNFENVTPQEEYEILLSEVEFFEKKYQGPYENTLKIKIEKTNEEIIDENEWKYLLKRIKM